MPIVKEIEAAAEAIYNTMPLQEERRVPTTHLNPKYERQLYSFTWKECKTEDRDYALEFYRKAKAALEAAEQAKWLPISEYNIDIHPNCVLVYDRLPIPARYDSEGGRWMVGGKFLDHEDYFVALRVNPTHFQYLPEPPKEVL